MTADGGSIRIKQVGFVNQGDNLSICIENDDSLLHVYQGPGQNVSVAPKSDVPCPHWFNLNSKKQKSEGFRDQ